MNMEMISLIGIILSGSVAYQSILIGQLTSRIEGLERTLSDLLLQLSKRNW